MGINIKRLFILGVFCPQQLSTGRETRSMKRFDPFKICLFLAFLQCSSFCLAQGYSGGTAPGTLVVFSKFDVQGDSDTELKIVNSGELAIRFKYNYVCPGIPRGNDNCAKLDRSVFLTPHQTAVIDVDPQHPPCARGFVVGYPIDANNQPFSYNFLYGSYQIVAGRRIRSENAVAIQSVKPTGQVLGTSAGFSFTPGADQDFAPMAPILVSDFEAVNPELMSTRLVLVDIGAAIGRRNPISNVFIDFWNSAEVPFSTSLEFICWTEVTLDQIDANFLVENLGTRHGSLKIESILSCPIPGACPPIVERAPLLLAILQEGNGMTIRGLPQIFCNDGDPSTIDGFDPNLGCVARSSN